MPLRSELQYQPPTPETVQRIAALVAAIESCIESGVDASDSLASLQSTTGRQLTVDDIESYPGAYSLTDFARQLACRPPRRTPGIERAEIICIAQHIIDAVGGTDEAELLYYMELFDAQVPLPHASDLVFHPPASYAGMPSDWSPTAQEVVDLAMQYKPIAL
jgi:hypothetical protein